MTVSAYQGVGSLAAVIDLAQGGGKGLFVLAATSNPEGVELQTAVRDRGGAAGETVAAGIVLEVGAHNSGADSLGSMGIVLGATVSAADFGIDLGQLAKTPILAPGFGEQGALVSHVGRIFGPAAPNVIVSIGRSVLRAGPKGLATALAQTADETEMAFRS
jgi:orotidine-5'-phosphate decarboxylase